MSEAVITMGASITRPVANGKHVGWRDRTHNLELLAESEKRAVRSYAKYIIGRLVWWVKYRRREGKRFTEYRKDIRINTEDAGKEISVNELLDYIFINEFPRRYLVATKYRAAVEKAVRALIAAELKVRPL